MMNDEPLYSEGEGQLTSQEVIAANVAWRVSEFFRRFDGACYRSVMFLRLYLKEKHGIEGRAIVGFVNDGEGAVYASHAWFEYEGKLTDIALSRPFDRKNAKPGRLIIQGVVVEPGHEYTYHESMPQIGRELIQEYKSNSLFREVIQGQEENHAEASICSNDDQLSRAYLDRAPDGWTYERMANEVEKTLTSTD